MEKEQYRSVIRFLFLDGKTCEEIKTKLDAVYGNSSPSMTTVRYWFNEFKRGHSSVFDEERPGRPPRHVLADRRTKVYEVAEAVGVSYGTAFNILHDNLGMKKLSARWVPRLLTVDNKRMRLSISKQCLELFKRNSNKFLRRVVTVDETWIHYTSETKQQSKQWTLSGEQKVLFHQDNTPAHSSAVATVKLVKLRYELLPHPKEMSNEEVIAETEACFAKFDKSYFSEGLTKWQKHWEMYPSKRRLR
ncbi:SETMR methyltransferase, partial [Acromyrmex heyeri]